jgi:RNA polymerase sigma factor (TIGR02999 family)
MVESSDDAVRELFYRWQGGDDTALQKLMPLVYEELRRIARRHLRGEREDHTLQTTALVHEAYLRLIGHEPTEVQNRAHFIGITSHVMRQVLVDHARRRRSEKRQGGARISLSEELAERECNDVDVLTTHELLIRLAALDAQQARIVELRYFGGLSIAEAAEVLGVSAATVKRDWATARAWLHRELGRSRSR